MEDKKMAKQSMDSSLEKLWYLADEDDEDETYVFDLNEFLAIQIHSKLSSKSVGTDKSLNSTLDEKYDAIQCDFLPELEFLLASQSHTVVPIYSLNTFEEEYKIEFEVLVKLIDITFEQWLDLKFGDHKKVDKEIMEGVVATWLIQSYRKQFEEYMKIKRRLEVNGINTDVECHPTNVEFPKWLASKFNNHKTMNWYTKNALWLYWKRGDDEEVLTYDEFFDFEEENLREDNEIAKTFRIEIDIFDLETPLCK
ncbi:hypothetical protein Tco_0199543 [Tanacetum coccineum]